MATSPLVSLSPPCRACLPFQNESILIDGGLRSITRCFCVALVGILGSISSCKPTTSIRDGQGARFFYRWTHITRSVWSGTRKRRIKTLPIKGLLGQEMVIDDYLQYIRAEALAYERRSTARSSGWRARQIPLW